MYWDKVKWSEFLVAGEPGADQGDDRSPETRGAPKALAGDTPTPETKARDLQADPGGSAAQRLHANYAVRCYRAGLSSEMCPQRQKKRRLRQKKIQNATQKLQHGQEVSQRGPVSSAEGLMC